MRRRPDVQRKPQSLSVSLGGLLVSLALIFAGCESRQAIPGAFVGKWQSDEQLTLESMRASDLVDAEARFVFENGFFGQLIVEYRLHEGRSYFADEGEPPDFEAHVIVDSGPNFVILRSPDNEELGLATERTWYVDGDMMIVQLEEWGFVEVFRRIDE